MSIQANQPQRLVYVTFGGVHEGVHFKVRNHGLHSTKFFFQFAEDNLSMCKHA